MRRIRLVLSWCAFVMAAGAAFGDTYIWNSGSGDWAAAGNWTPPNGPPGSSDTAVINRGTVTVTGDTTIGTLDLSGGTLTGSGSLTVSNVMNWTAGGMSGSGRTVIAPGAKLNMANGSGVDLTLSQWTLENGGTASWTGDGQLGCGNGAVLTNRAGALWEVRNDQAFSHSGGGRPAVPQCRHVSQDDGYGHHPVYHRVLVQQLRPGGVADRHAAV